MGSAWASGTSCSRLVGEDLHDIPLLCCYLDTLSLLSLSATQFHPLYRCARFVSLCIHALHNAVRWPRPRQVALSKCQRSLVLVLARLLSCCCCCCWLALPQ